MKKIFKKIESNKFDDENFYLDRLVDDKNGFVIELSNESSSKRVSLKFENVIGYRNFDEGDRLKTQSKHPEICVAHTFFETKNSDLIDWLKAESYEMKDDMDFTHYLISTPNDVVEVITVEKCIFQFSF